MALDDRRGLRLEQPGLGRCDRSLAVDRVADRVDDSPKEGVADGDRKHSTRRADLVAFLDARRVAHDDGADRVFVKVQCHTDETTGELEEFGRHGVRESGNPGDPVTYTITIATAGPSDSPGTAVTDAFPAALTGVTWTCTPTAGSACAEPDRSSAASITSPSVQLSGA